MELALMEYRFIVYSSLAKPPPPQSGHIVQLSLIEDMTRSKIVAVFKTHEQVRELIEQLRPFAHSTMELDQEKK